MNPEELADARERCGFWGPETDLPQRDKSADAIKRWDREMLARFPGFTIEQIVAGLTEPIFGNYQVNVPRGRL